LSDDTPQNLILKEFCRFRNIKTENNEFISSGEIVDYIEKHPDVLKAYDKLNDVYLEYKEFQKELMQFYEDEKKVPGSGVHPRF